jgi:hypothetical protein
MDSYSNSYSPAEDFTKHLIRLERCRAAFRKHNCNPGLKLSKTMPMRAESWHAACLKKRRPDHSSGNWNRVVASPASCSPRQLVRTPRSATADPEWLPETPVLPTLSRSGSGLGANPGSCFPRRLSPQSLPAEPRAARSPRRVALSCSKDEGGVGKQVLFFIPHPPSLIPAFV